MYLAFVMLVFVALYSQAEAAATGNVDFQQDADQEGAEQFLNSFYKTPYYKSIVEQPAESWISWNAA